MKNIAAALVKFHANLKPITKDAQNPFFKSDYLTLSGILDAVRQPLASNGIAIIQSMRVEESNTILVTVLLHESGEEIVSQMIMPVLADPQKLGSLITYYKRYQLQALLGISTSDEDDDGNSVSQQPFKTQQRPFSEPMPKNIASFPASEPQKNALKRMGIKFNDDITKQEASKLIEEANNKRV